MKYTKCKRCDLNYIDLEKGQEYCDSCMRELGRSPKSKPTQAHRPVRVISPTKVNRFILFFKAARLTLK